MLLYMDRNCVINLNPTNHLTTHATHPPAIMCAILVISVWILVKALVVYSLLTIDCIWCGDCERFHGFGLLGWGGRLRARRARWSP